MDVNQQIRGFKDFIEKHYHAELLENVRKGKLYLDIDFSLISRFDPDLADILLDEAEESIKAIEIAIEQFDLPKKEDKKNQNSKVQVFIRNLPKSSYKLVKHLRAEDGGKLICIEGVVRNIRATQPRSYKVTFECPSCGDIKYILQETSYSNKLKQPTKCGCGRKDKFRIVEEEEIDVQKIEIEDLPEKSLSGGMANVLRVILKDNITSPDVPAKYSSDKLSIGNRVKIVGYLKKIPYTTKSGAESIDKYFLFEAVSLENIDIDEIDLNISEDEEKKIKELARNPYCMEILKDLFASDIFGNDPVKEGLILQLVGGRTIRDGASMKVRGDFHILLIGEPGAGKSSLLKKVTRLMPNVVPVNGKTTSLAGLTATAVKDEFLGGWVLQGGAILRANNSILAVDELDKLKEDAINALHESLEQQTLTVNKAGFNGPLQAAYSMIAAANPKNGRFNKNKPIAEQFNLPSTLVDRFDLIFIFKDIPDKEKDKLLSQKILKNRRGENFISSGFKDIKEAHDFFRKFIFYVKRQKPVLSDEAIDKISDFFVEIRQAAKTNSEFEAIPMTAREVEAVSRLAEAYAKIRLSDKVTVEDANRAIALLKYTLEQIATDPKTGQIDIDRIRLGLSSRDREMKGRIFAIMENIANSNNGLVDKKLLKTICSTEGISLNELDSYLASLKNSGDISEPKRGFFEIQNK